MSDNPIKTMKILNLSRFLSILILAGIVFLPSPAFAEELSVNFSASPQTIEKGDQSTLSWSSDGAVECKVIGKGIMANGGTPKSLYTGLGSGIIPVAPDKTTIYSISCKGKDNSFIPAQGQVTVTVTGTSDSSNEDGSGSDTNASSEDPNFTAGCVVNPERTRKGELVTFTATSVGGEGTLHYQWKGDVVGGGQKIFEIFTSAGTKTATLTVTDSRDIKVVTACNVFIEPDASVTSGSTTGGGSSNTSSEASPGSGTTNQSETQGTTNGETNGATPAQTETDTDTSQAAAASEGGAGTLFLVLLISIVVNMAALFYFFVYAKKKKEEKTRLEGAEFTEEMATA